MQKLRIGIIGAGAIVETNHLPAISINGQAEIAWIYDKNPSRAELVSKMYGIPSLGAGPVEDAIADVDVCLLATPYGVRGPYIEACRKLGKALVVEKPFAFSREEHRGYSDGFKPWAIGVNFQRRFYRSAGILRRMIRTGIFGPLQSIRFTQGNFSLKGGAGYLSDTKLSGGGVIAESAIHGLDLILYITDALDLAVTDIRSLHRGSLDYDSVFTTTIHTKNGSIDTRCEITTLRNLDNGIELQFAHARVGSDLSPDGKIFIRDKENGILNFSLSDEPGSGSDSPGAGRISEAFWLFWQQFLSGLQSHTPNPTNASGSLLTSAWIEDIYKEMKAS